MFFDAIGSIKPLKYLKNLPVSQKVIGGEKGSKRFFKI